MSTDIPILFEHPDWLLCEKPSGMDFHDDQGTPGFLTLLKSQTGQSQLLPVHRLDKPTSGLILVAKTEEACRLLNERFAQRRIDKFYLALVPKSLKKKQGAIIGDMEKSRRSSFKLLKTKVNPAITQFFSYSLGEGIRVCLLKPKTGKTHQLRVALKSLSAAIIGDATYGGESSDRLYLHAYALRFEYGGEWFQFTQPPTHGSLFLKESFNEWLAQQSLPWELAWPGKN